MSVQAKATTRGWLLLAEARRPCAAAIRRKQFGEMWGGLHRCWHFVEMFVTVNGETHCLWRATVHAERRDLCAELGPQDCTCSDAFAFV